MTDPNRTTVRVRERHEIPSRPPLRVRPGEIVTVGRRDDEWPAFVFIETAAGSGWVPSRYLSADAGSAAVLRPYDTTELPVGDGDTIEVIERDDASGWWWCRSADGREGWVPVRCLGEQPTEKT